VTTAVRIPELPDIPTLQEAGLKDFVSDTWNAISAPPKTPPAIIAKLNAAINAVLTDPEMVTHFQTMHLAAVGGTTQKMAEMIKADTDRWGGVIRGANVTLD
jgi:tripartite-type tricarboxylate transporter receptor subunit TctC